MTGPGKFDTLPQGSQALKTGGCACPRVQNPRTVYPSSSVCICIMRIDPRGKSKCQQKSVPPPPLVRGCVLEELSSRKSYGQAERSGEADSANKIGKARGGASNLGQLMRNDLT